MAKKKKKKESREGLAYCGLQFDWSYIKRQRVHGQREKEDRTRSFIHDPGHDGRDDAIHHSPTPPSPV